MAADSRKRQKKKERRTQKRNDKKRGLVRRQAVPLIDQLQAAAEQPILHCRITETLWSEGLGMVLLSRELPNGRIALANVMVDRYCLGVKDAHGEIMSRSQYTHGYLYDVRHLDWRDVPPADARKLIDEAIVYARGLGFSPHPDFAEAQPLFESIDPAVSAATFEFGKDGKPFFIVGPNDSPARCRQVMATLTRTCGPDGFRNVLPSEAPASEADWEMLDWDEDEDFDGGEGDEERK